MFKFLRKLKPAPIPIGIEGYKQVLRKEMAKRNDREVASIWVRLELEAMVRESVRQSGINQKLKVLTMNDVVICDSKAYGHSDYFDKFCAYLAKLAEE